MKVISVEYIDESYDLCDLEIDGGDNNYIAEGVVVHNTFCQAGYVPEEDMYIISSKGIGAKGLAFKLNERNEGNLYVRTIMAGDYSIMDKIRDMANRLGHPVYLMGEIFGRGVQDLKYGQDSPMFRAFDMYIGKPGKGRYANSLTLRQNCESFDIPIVPVLYQGQYSYDKVRELTDGSEQVSGEDQNIREGIVVKPEIERTDTVVGRVAMKHISEKYLTRKGDTTELQ